MDWSVLLVLIGGGIYCLPLIVAKRKRHHNQDAIAFINIFFGWTVVGWVFALALVSTGGTQSTMKQCVSCRDFIMSFSPICPHCRSANTTVGW